MKRKEFWRMKMKIKRKNTIEMKNFKRNGVEREKF